MCKTLSISKSAYYEYKAREGKSRSEGELERSVISIFREHKRRYGSRRIVAELQAQGIYVGRRRVGSIMKHYGLVAIQPKSYVPRTTKSPAGMLRSPNLLVDRPPPIDINEIWVGDITYLPMHSKGWSYLSTWQDVFSRYIVGWEVLESMKSELVVSSVNKAIYQRQPDKGLIVHSDGGGQYGSRAFRSLIANRGIEQSMARRDNHYDNAMAESFFSRFKAELLTGEPFRSLTEARSACFDYIEGYYNTKRRHSSLGYKSPLQFKRELQQG